MIESLTVAVAFVAVASIAAICLWPSFTALRDPAPDALKPLPAHMMDTVRTPTDKARKLPAAATMVIAQASPARRGDAGRAARP